MKRILLFLAIIAITLGMSAKPMTRKELAVYAASLKGMKKAELKNAVYKLIYPKTVLDYGRGAGHTWDGFYKTDRYDGNKCRDRYSNGVFTFTSPTSPPGGMNIEHSFPKSWWGGVSNNAYKDLFNLMPSESGINSSKSNYGMGKVGNANVDNGCTKVGNGTGALASKNLWEPADKWKGDFSRGYMYMATAHQHLNGKYTGEGLTSLEHNEWPTLKAWAYKLYLEWARQDKVDAIEVERNNTVHDIQHNRNLFVDYPMLAEYIWGDSTEVAFDPSMSITTATDDNRYEGVAIVVPGDTPGGGGEEPGGEEPGGEEPGTTLGDEVTVTFNFGNPASIGITEPSASSGTDIGNSTYVSNNVTFSATTAEGGVPTRVWNSKGTFTLRVYYGGTIKFKAPQGYVITGIRLKYSKNSFGSATPGELSTDGSTWTGKSEAVTFEANASVQVTTVDITISKLQPTAVDSIEADTESGVVYNLAGQRVDEGYRGIVIKNGRKFLRR